MTTAGKVSVNKTQGVIKTILKKAVAAWGTHTFSSSKIDFISIKNSGTEDVAVAWDNDDKEHATNPEYRAIKPEEVIEWAGLDSRSGDVSLKNEHYNTATSMNDNDVSFETIAQLIEEQL